MNRSTTAFLVAPLWVPLIAVPYAWFVMFPYPEQHMWVVVAGVVSALFAYVGVFLFGMPLFFFLRARNWTSLWIAGLAGLTIGTVMWLAFMVDFVFFLGEGFRGVGEIAKDWRSQVTFVWVPSSLGALVGITLWAIARPDRSA